MAAKIDRVDQAYWDEVIKPLVDSHPNVEFIGEINERQKAKFLGEAAALIFPIDWPEPFGLVMIEAMACGTPVIALRSGSTPEVVDDAVPHRHGDRAKERRQFFRRHPVQPFARSDRSRNGS